MAEVAASWALFGPLPIPKPIKAMPALRKVLLTSAKSRLITAGIKIKSVTVFTDCAKTLSDSENASETGHCPFIINNLSLETTIIASTFSFNLLKPSTD